MANELRSFVFVSEGKVISPLLITVREYASWMEKYFDEYTCQLELYIPSNKNGGTVREWHPGTKIGRFFDMQEFRNTDLISWYLPTNTKGMQQLIKHGYAGLNDSRKGMLRVYTWQQIELYLKTSIDNSFSIANKVLSPIQITLTKEEATRLVRPVVHTRKKLF